MYHYQNYLSRYLLVTISLFLYSFNQEIYIKEYDKLTKRMVYKKNGSTDYCVGFIYLQKKKMTEYFFENLLNFGSQWHVDRVVVNI